MVGMVVYFYMYMRKKDKILKEYLENEKSAEYHSKIGFGLDKKIEFKSIKDDSLIDSLVTGGIIFTKLEDSVKK